MNGGRAWEAFRQAFPDLKMISSQLPLPMKETLPRDRYIRMCKSIDEEIHKFPNKEETP